MARSILYRTGDGGIELLSQSYTSRQGGFLPE